MTVHVVKDGWIKAIQPEELQAYKENGWNEFVKKSPVVTSSKRGKKEPEEEVEEKEEE